MKFNYARRKREFDREWKRIEELCALAGTAPEAIAKARKDTWNEVKSDRRFAMHTASGVDYDAITTDPSTDYSQGGTRIAVAYDCYNGHSRYWWIENPSDERLTAKISHLTNYEKELLTLKFYEQRTFQEIEKILHVPDATLYDQVERLIKLMRN